jgi:membrane-anchored protein YejM (alkaline phosphatase superfamily)
MMNDDLFAGRAVGGPYDAAFLTSETGPVLLKRYPVTLNFDNLNMAVDATATLKFATYKWDYIKQAFIFEPDKSDEPSEGKAASEGGQEMKLWLVSQAETDRRYPAYVAFVVAAESEEKAQKALPFELGLYGWMYTWIDGRLCRKSGDQSLEYASPENGWATHLENVKVKLLGDAAPGVVAEVIMASRS